MGTSLAAELQKALFDLLKGDTQLTAALGGANIFEQVPANVIFPYLTCGRTSIYDWSTATESASEQLLTLHVWSKAKSKQETQAILRLIRQRLDAGSLALGSHHPVNLRFEFSEIRYDDDLSVHHGLVRYRAMIEDAA
ncbi:DUF3168 domain-containing protein [Mesorhizobium sp. 1M-11]|uniref:DUF3168 domain-containing protein n=1 Tax=Mesorhizobium sp. 1M-11 TaxID=1529006 RepID=UPI0006C74A17|nr:DUF3168 domain-containing protein [Mesorhizobium sp. 1M-11]